ncbi:MAG: S4 domain-containing protein, partial [Oscillospiraceae bacterium]
MAKIRLDQLIFDRGLTPSRERAKTPVMSGVVFVDGQRADKPGMPVAPDARVEIHGGTLRYVSR